MNFWIFLALFISSLFISSLLLFSKNGIFTYISQKKDIKEKEKKIKLVEEEIKNIKEKINLIDKGDKEYIEYILRKSGYIKENEFVLKIEEKDGKDEKDKNIKNK